MSPTPLDLPVLLSQIPYVAKIAHAETSKPEVQQQLFGPLIDAHIRENESKVRQVDKKEKAVPVDRDGHQQQQHAAPDRKRQKKEEDESPDTGASTASPWSGNIVNVKI
ncbi:MAG: hypothetical protein V3571_15255 [Pseudodesulfovibrio sp.]